MILYNVTVKIEAAIHDNWLSWMLDVHIPEVMATGMFLRSKISEILIPEDDCKSYAIQYLCKDMAHFNEYQHKYAAQLQKSHTDRYRDQYVAFRTVMRIIQDF